jgi:hypothetical protein
MLWVLQVQRLRPPLCVRVRVARISAMRTMLRRRVARVAAAACVSSAAIAAAAVHRGLRRVERGLRTLERRRRGWPLLLCCGWPRKTAATAAA